MNKKELVRAIAQKKKYNKHFKKEMTQKDIETVVSTTFTTIADEMAAGNEVAISGFGKFIAVEKPARECRNPQTGQTFMSEAHLSPKFKASSNLKDLVK